MIKFFLSRDLDELEKEVSQFSCNYNVQNITMTDMASGILFAIHYTKEEYK